MSAEALDRILIAECIARYGRAVDERDLDGLAACFADDLVWAGVVTGGERVGPFIGHAGIAGFLAAVWSDQADQRRHVFTNVVVEALGDATATAQAYLQLWSSFRGRTVPVTTGSYRFELSESEGVWRVRRLDAVWDAPFTGGATTP